jgi:hypothetical protein
MAMAIDDGNVKICLYLALAAYFDGGDFCAINYLWNF